MSRFQTRCLSLGDVPAGWLPYMLRVVQGVVAQPDVRIAGSGGVGGGGWQLGCCLSSPHWLLVGLHGVAGSALQGDGGEAAVAVVALHPLGQVLAELELIADGLDGGRRDGQMSRFW